jgi:hypothetical protein
MDEIQYTHEDTGRTMIIFTTEKYKWTKIILKRKRSCEFIWINNFFTLKQLNYIHTPAKPSVRPSVPPCFSRTMRSRKKW